MARPRKADKIELVHFYREFNHEKTGDKLSFADIAKLLDSDVKTVFRWHKYDQELSTE